MNMNPDNHIAVIPAQAGIQMIEQAPRKRGDSRFSLLRRVFF